MEEFSLMNSDITANKNKEIVIGSKGQQRVKLCGEFEGFKFMAGTNRKTTSELELRNVADRWIIYKLKCTIPINFTIHPASCGLLRPLDGRQHLRIALLPGYDMNVGQSEFVLETIFVSESESEITKDDVDPTAGWQEEIKNDITVTRFPIQFVCNENEMDAEAPILFLDKYPTNKDGSCKPKTRKQKILNFLARLRRDDVVAPFLYGLLSIFLFCFFVGYFMGETKLCSTCH